MAETYLVFSVSTVILLILLTKIDVSFELFSDSKILRVDFFLFTLTYKLNKKKRRRKKADITAIKNLILRLAKHSFLILKSLTLSVPEKEPDIFSVRYRNLDNLLLISVYSLAGSFRSQKIQRENVRIISGKEFSLLSLDATVSLRAYYALACLSSYLFDLFRKKAKGGLRAYGKRKQDERNNTIIS